MTGALTAYISTENERFQPMNANFGIVPMLDRRIKDKKEKYKILADRAMEKLEEAIKNKRFLNRLFFIYHLYLFVF